MRSTVFTIRSNPGRKRVPVAVEYVCRSSDSSLMGSSSVSTASHAEEIPTRLRLMAREIPLLSNTQKKERIHIHTAILWCNLFFFFLFLLYTSIERKVFAITSKIAQSIAFVGKQNCSLRKTLRHAWRVTRSQYPLRDLCNRRNSRDRFSGEYFCYYRLDFKRSPKDPRSYYSPHIRFALSLFFQGACDSRPSEILSGSTDAWAFVIPDKCSLCNIIRHMRVISLRHFDPVSWNVAIKRRTSYSANNPPTLPRLGSQLTIRAGYNALTFPAIRYATFFSHAPWKRFAGL